MLLIGRFEDTFGLSILLVLGLLGRNFLFALMFRFDACVWGLRVFTETKSDAFGAALKAEAKTGLHGEVGSLTISVIDEGDLLTRAVSGSARVNVAIEV